MKKLLPKIAAAIVLAPPVLLILAITVWPGPGAL
jgi:hypothetical protein